MNRREGFRRLGLAALAVYAILAATDAGLIARQTFDNQINAPWPGDDQPVENTQPADPAYADGRLTGRGREAYEELARRGVIDDAVARRAVEAAAWRVGAAKGAVRLSWWLGALAMIVAGGLLWRWVADGFRKPV